jgi:pimeloyl-ACP methyl ester carboxylesterase
MAKSYPLRTRIAGDIVAEIVLPERQTGKVAILATGLPSSVSKGEMLRFLADQGYVAVFPRYRGTWESDGYFLEDSPAQDIHDVIEGFSLEKPLRDVATGLDIPLKKTKSIILFGGSFGGPAVLLNSQHPLVKKVIATSPVLDWKQEGEDEPFEWHVRFVTAGFGGVYRVRHKTDWQKLRNTNFYNPVDRIQDIDAKKIFILHAKDDRIVPYEPLIGFAQETGVRYYLKPRGGHGLRIRHLFLWKKIAAFLESR